MLSCSRCGLILICVLLGAEPLYANTVIGKTYPIREKDLLVVIEEKLQQKQQSGELEQLQKDSQDKTEAYIQRPPSVAAIPRTTENAVRYFDPSITVPYAMRDAKGAILHPAGTRVNPLDYVDLHSSLLFFDSDDPVQLNWVRGFINMPDVKVKLVLVLGSPGESMEKLKRRVAFDQGGHLVHKLGIRQVPAMVTQEGKRLRIDELVP